MARKIALNIPASCVEDYRAGTSLTQLQLKYGIERHALSGGLRALGIEIIQNNQQYTHNVDCLSVIDTEEKAYWLGFLYADGYINPKGVLELTLAATDRAHLEKFRKFISPAAPIADKLVTLGRKIHQAVRFSIKSQQLGDNLRLVGLSPDKTTRAFPSEDMVPPALLRHFLRGYFDGDGSVGIYLVGVGRQLKLSLDGMSSILTGWQQAVADNVTGYTPTGVLAVKNQKSYRWQKGGTQATLAVCAYLYDEAAVFLARKRDVYLTFKQEVAAR